MVTFTTTTTITKLKINNFQPEFVVYNNSLLTVES